MIGSFWNLCRACPSMPVDKLHSEYRSTYRWHEYTGPRQEVVRRPPLPNGTAPSGEKSNEIQNSTRVKGDETIGELPKLEPALPRRKKHPELAYRHHEFLSNDGERTTDKHETSTVDRARSEERGDSHWKPSRRSRSEGPAGRSAMVDQEKRRESDPDLDKTGRDSGLLRKAISKISTEYRLQFAWPQGHTSRRDAAGESTAPRKSLSMGAIKPSANAMVHRKRIDLENKDASELEPLVNDATIYEDHQEEKGQPYKKTFSSEYTKKFRPFSQYEYSEGRFTQREKEAVEENHRNAIIDNSGGSWYREVVELRKKAGEYKHRGWGTELVPENLSEFYNKQIELWDQVSRRSSLSALSLASTTHRSYTKEEKDEQNVKKSSPTKAMRNAENSVRIMKDAIRHHLERTTGGSELDGIILSPTREKLEPTVPKKDDDSRSSQKNSPQKYSPQKNSPQKHALQKRHSQRSKSALRTTRSQSVGPADIPTERRSPKRQSRSATAKEEKIPNNAMLSRRPRPSSLITTASSRSKCSSVPPKSEDDRLAKAKSNKNQSNIDSHVQNLRNKELRKGGRGADPSIKAEKPESVDAPAIPEPQLVDLEPVVKSPPEPTRVKSPEQILMRSPDPVNWTVPLDTGKTFTVTQNIREGDIGTRPHSDLKAWTPPEVPLPAVQSAPPELAEQSKEQARKPPENSSDTTASLQELSIASFADLTEQSNEDHTTESDQMSTAHADEEDLMIEVSTAVKVIPEINPALYFKPEPPIFAPTSGLSFASEVLQKARNRFDRFWEKTSKDEEN